MELLGALDWVGWPLAAAAGVVVGVGLGWWVGARRARARGKSQGGVGEAFYRGVSYLIAEHTDEAIEEFRRAVMSDTDAVETYMVLANLFRQKGEIERAVRVRQMLIVRPTLGPAQRLEALYELGVDYRKGGLFNRAVDVFNQVLAIERNHEGALRQLVSLYEEMGEWELAFETLKRLGAITGEDTRLVLAHYRTERAKQLMEQKDFARAEEAFSQALAVDNRCLDAYLHWGELELELGRARKALRLWHKAAALAPVHAPLVIRRVAEAEEVLGRGKVEKFIEDLAASDPPPPTLVALARLELDRGRPERALKLVERAIEAAPGYLQAHRLKARVLRTLGREEQALSAYWELVDSLEEAPEAYRCTHCGFVAPALSWKCPKCHSWDTMVPEW